MARLLKQAHVFLVPEDEEAFLAGLRTGFPETALVDGQIWKEAEPPVRERLADCDSNYVYLWNRALYPNLPLSPRPGQVGGYRGPSVGPVIQWARCVESNGVLLAGSLDATTSDDAMIGFVKGVWSTLRRQTRDDLITLLGHAAREFRIGEATRRWFEADSTHRLRSRNSEVYFVIAGNNRDPRKRESGWAKVE